MRRAQASSHPGGFCRGGPSWCTACWWTRQRWQAGREEQAVSLSKLKPLHLQRRAYVYVRQSSTAQVLEHAESRKRQYALVQRAQALGWPAHAIEVVDEDQGKSGASVEGRSGFERL